MRIVITGALGHIGSKLIRDIPKKIENVNITVVDNLFTNRFCSLFNYPYKRGIQLVQEDILNENIEKYIKNADVVIHLAAITDAASSFDNQESIEKINFEGTKRIAEICFKHSIPMIFPSTTSVYGSQDDIVDENCTADQLKPQSPYAESKIKAENYLKELGEEGFKFVIFRLGTIFGISEGMRFHTAVNKFIWQASCGQPLTVWSTAMDQNRPYLDLDDAVKAFIFFIENKIYDNNTYNVVTLNTSVRCIIEEIKKVIPQIEINYVDSRIMNQLSYNVRSEKIKERGFQFSGSLSQGVEDTIKLLCGIKGYSENG